MSVVMSGSKGVSARSAGVGSSVLYTAVMRMMNPLTSTFSAQHLCDTLIYAQHEIHNNKSFNSFVLNLK